MDYGRKPKEHLTEIDPALHGLQAAVQCRVGVVDEERRVLLNSPAIALYRFSARAEASERRRVLVTPQGRRS